MEQPKAQRYTIAVLGGTGNEGPGLALRWAQAGHTVIIGSRQKEKAERVAGELNVKRDTSLAAASPILGMANPEAAAACDIAVLTVPYSAQNALLESLVEPLQGKPLINVNVALKPPKVARVYIPAEGSASEQAQAILGDGVTVVAAFQNVSADQLDDPDSPIDCDVLVCGDSKTAKQIAIELSEDLGTRGIDAGPLVNAKAVEAMTSVLIGINIRYRVHGSGIRITGLEGKLG
ncbi:MAG: NADPH-dependent F420 reductase [Anaerolineae bacterium]|nr:NADPH-dependent F420 reductase [Anaerolineae bacterium]